MNANLEDRGCVKSAVLVSQWGLNILNICFVALNFVRKCSVIRIVCHVTLNSIKLEIKNATNLLLRV